MLNRVSAISRVALNRAYFGTTLADDVPEPSFLQMVQKNFERAAKHTRIRPDILEFYKKPDNLLKFNLVLRRGYYY